MISLLLFNIQMFECFKINLNRRGIQIQINKEPPRMKINGFSESWYFAHFNAVPDYELLLNQGINVSTHNMINKFWYSFFLTPIQAQFLTKIAFLRPITQKEKIINFPLIKYSDYIQFEASSTFNPFQDLPANFSFDKIDTNIYQITSINNSQLIYTLSSNEKINSIWPTNETVYFNSRAAGYTQYNSQIGLTSSSSKDIVIINRVLENKGLTGSGETIMIADTYLDTNSTFFFDPQHPEVEKEKLIDDHRKIRYMYTTQMSDKNKLNAHGTHVAGCAAGASYFPSNESGIQNYNGVAPEAKIAFSMNNFVNIVRDIIKKTNPCASSNSWGERYSSISSDNTWSRLAKEFSDTLIIFAAGNYGSQKNMELDFYETALSPGIGKNVLTVGALSSVPIENTDSFEKQIYIFSYKPLMKKWSLRSDESVKNPSVEELFTKGIVSDLKITYNSKEDFSKNKRILVFGGKNEFLEINKENPPFMAISLNDFEADESELSQFKQLFPVVVLNNESIMNILNYSSTIHVETNFVTGKNSKISRAPYSSKGLTEMGLMKPEIMAPGTAVISARSDPNGGFSHEDYMARYGTSMSTPNIAGATTLISQYFKSGKYRSGLKLMPSSSLLKAVLINAADPLNMSAPHPNADTGFGQLNLGRYIMNGATDKDTKVIVGDHIEVTGNEHIYFEVKVVSKDEDFRVTISYLDEVLNDDSSAALVVDLDLVVVAPDGKTVYRGNQRIDNTEEMFSTIERVIVNKDDVQIGTYEIHVFSHIPEIVPNRKSEFSIVVFGSISYDNDTISFSPAKNCVPVEKGHGKCNAETTLNECTYDEFEGDGYNGHSCQNEIIAMNNGLDSFRQKRIIEIEPYGTKYINGYIPIGEGIINMTLIISSVTNFIPKYSYSFKVKDKNPLMREIEVDNILMNGDFSESIYNFRNENNDLKSGIYVLVYNKSPKKTTFAISYKYNIEIPTPTPIPPDPTSIPVTAEPIISSDSESATSESTASESTASESTTFELTTSESTASESTASELTESESTTSESTTSESTTSESTTSELATSESITFESTESELTASESTASESTTSESTESESTTSELATSELITFESTESELTASESTESESTEYESTTSELITFESTESESTASESTESELTASESTESELTASESTESESTESKSTPSELTASESTASELIESESKASESVASESTTSEQVFPTAAESITANTDSPTIAESATSQPIRPTASTAEQPIITTTAQTVSPAYESATEMLQETMTMTITQVSQPEYKVCADLSDISSEYEISYIISTGNGHKIIAFHDMNEEKLPTPFYINVSLIKSPKCSERFLGTINASTSFECIHVTVDMFPKECVSNGSSNKKKIIIISITASCIILLITVIIIYLVILRKNKKERMELNSQTLGKNLLEDEFNHEDLF